MMAVTLFETVKYTIFSAVIIVTNNLIVTMFSCVFVETLFSSVICIFCIYIYASAHACVCTCTHTHKHNYNACLLPLIPAGFPPYPHPLNVFSSAKAVCMFNCLPYVNGCFAFVQLSDMKPPPSMLYKDGRFVGPQYYILPPDPLVNSCDNPKLFHLIIPHFLPHHFDPTDLSTVSQERK